MRVPGLYLGLLNEKPQVGGEALRVCVCEQGTGRLWGVLRFEKHRLCYLPLAPHPTPSIILPGLGQEQR